MSTNYEMIEAAAKSLALRKLEQGFLIEALHTYTDLENNPVYWRIRLKHPQTGEKVIWPLHQNSEGRFVLKEPTFLAKKPLYKLHTLIPNSSDPIWIVEGELCADKLESLGLNATTSGGSGSAATVDWSLLKNRHIIIWPDNDEAGLSYAAQVTQLLKNLGRTIKQVDIKRLGLDRKADCVDWLKLNPAATMKDVEALALCEIKIDEATSSVNIQDHYSKKSGNFLSEIIKNIEFFHDEQKQSYASFCHKGKIETWPINSTLFKGWLSQQFWDKYQKTASESTLQEIISIMCGKAQYEGRQHTLFTRVGCSNHKIYLNLADEQKQVVEITADGWKVLTTSPVKFKYLFSMKALPTPQADGNIDLLWKHINIAEADRKLVLAWVLDCWIPYTNFPLLVLTGFQGSAKSTTQEILRQLIDPNICNLRNAPRHSDDIPIAAANNWLVSYNNVNKLTQQNQDDLCCLSTGGGSARRKFYTNADESVINIKRPVILNGITNIITAQDLVSRGIVIDLPPISDFKRQSEHEINNAFIQDYPSIVSGLVELLSKVLKLLPTIKLSEKPRMADFALLGCALEKILEWPEGSFMQSYIKNYQGSIASSLEDSMISMALIKFMHKHDEFEGTYAELLNLLNSPLYKPENAYGWPSSPKALANCLKLQLGGLQLYGVQLRTDPVRQKRGYVLKIAHS